ncbi:hypothetical protein PV327_007757 [Microctonus hyperodae]|uniref:Uncharacterized protein n=1 Tax=Microctonus hyperodae TaxID=165561 RepID=A0AA39KZ19_MICHY|nr:hypothetical protein PV327_007757 [Microctonus hyperodae]
MCAQKPTLKNFPIRGNVTVMKERGERVAAAGVVCCGWRRTCRLYISGSQPEIMERSHFGSSTDHTMEIHVQLEKIIRHMNCYQVRYKIFSLIIHINL